MPEPSASSKNISLTRLSFLRAVFWRPWVALVSVAWAILGVLDFLNSKIVPSLPEDFQRVWAAVYIFPSVSWRTRIIALLGLTVVVLFEGAYRFIRKELNVFSSQIQTLQGDVNSLKDQLKPKLDIVFEERFPFLYENKSLGNYDVRIGVKNISAVELSRVKVQLDQVHFGIAVYNSLPLHLARHKHLVEWPHITEFRLLPGETEYLDLAFHLLLNGYSGLAHVGESGIPDHIEKNHSYELTVTASASEGNPTQKRGVLSVHAGAPWITFRLVEGALP